MEAIYRVAVRGHLKVYLNRGYQTNDFPLGPKKASALQWIIHTLHGMEHTECEQSSHQEKRYAAGISS